MSMALRKEGAQKLRAEGKQSWFEVRRAADEVVPTVDVSGLEEQFQRMPHFEARARDANAVPRQGERRREAPALIQWLAGPEPGTARHMGFAVERALCWALASGIGYVTLMSILFGFTTPVSASAITATFFILIVGAVCSRLATKFGQYLKRRYTE